MSYDAECYCADCDGSLCVFCEMSTDAALANLASSLAQAGALCAARLGGMDDCIKTIETRRAHYGLYSKPGAMQTKPVTFAIIDEMLVFLGAMRERQDSPRPNTDRKPAP